MKLSLFLLFSLLSGSSYSQVEYGVEISAGYSHSVFPQVIDGESSGDQSSFIFESRKNRFYGPSLGAKATVKFPSRNFEVGIQSFYVRSFHPSFDQNSSNRSSRISYDMQQVLVGPTVGCYIDDAKRLKATVGLPITVLSYFNRDSKDFAGSNFESSRLYKGRTSVGFSSSVDYALFPKSRKKLFLGLQFFGGTSYPKSLLISRSSDPNDVFIEFERVGQQISTSEPNTDLVIRLHRFQFNLKYVFQAK